MKLVTTERTNMFEGLNGVNRKKIIEIINNK